mgnify:CR=1 FL=1
MSWFLQFAWVRRFSSFTAIALFLPFHVMTSVPATAAPLQKSDHVPCRDAELLPATHPDVRSLQRLIQKYNVSLTYPTDLGESPITRYEFGLVLNTVLNRVVELIFSDENRLSTSSDIQLLQRLKETYISSSQRSDDASLQDIQKLRSLIQKYNFLSLSKVSPIQFLKRYDFAFYLNTVLARFKQLTADSSNAIAKQDIETVQRLEKTYTAELAALRQRMDSLESRPSLLERQQFSTTTQLQGGAVYSVSGSMNQPNTGKVFVPPPARNIRGQDRLNNRIGGGTRNANPHQPIPTPPASAVTSFGNLRPDQRIHPPGTANTEGYNPIDENPFQRPITNPLSTFSIDVDTASYSNVRRFIKQGQQPPKDAVRIEELINYFSYDYPQPTDNQPFSVTTDLANAPWNPKHKVVQIGIQGKQLQATATPPSNLVFLVDVSGSMSQPNKLPLVKQSLCLLVNELKASDRVTLVVYAGQAGLVLPPTPGNQKATIMDAIERLEAGGSTAGGAGIQLAYQEAKKNFLPNGNNRVILATDGDFNVGLSSDAELVRLVEQKRDQGIFLTVLGYGMGNYKDSKMEQLANKGNGNYAYIDTILEARKVLVNDIRATLFTIAKDVKIQIEFNPTKVQAYRLIGYENRLLRDQDFNDDTKDAGEVGAGHSVTALYEIIPTGVETDIKLPRIDSLKYQSTDPSNSTPTNELMQVKIRYKDPNGSASKLITRTVIDQATNLDRASTNLKFATAVALYGMLLRDSEYKGTTNLDMVLQLATQAKGSDREGYRDEFIRLVQRYQKLLSQPKG